MTAWNIDHDSRACLLAPTPSRTSSRAVSDGENKQPHRAE